MNLQVHECRCPNCQQSKDYPDWQLHHQMNLFLSRLNEQQRRWYVALEFKSMGHGGDSRMALITGIDVETIRRGRRELDDTLSSRPAEGVRQEGARGFGGRRNRWRSDERAEVATQQLAALELSF